MFFPRRIAEPKTMDKLELDVFEKISRQSYKRWFIPLVDDVLQKSGLRKGTILDVGCGPGFLAKEFARRSRGFHIVGVDTSAYAISQARRNCRGMDSIQFMKGSVYKLPFPRNSFDLVVCKDSLHQFPVNPIKALREMVRVLKPGHILYIHDLRRDLPRALLRRVIPPNTAFKRLLYYSARAAYTKREAERFLRAIDVKPIEVKTRKVTKFMERKYRRNGIDPVALHEALVSRYVAIARKN